MCWRTVDVSVGKFCNASRVDDDDDDDAISSPASVAVNKRVTGRQQRHVTPPHAIGSNGRTSRQRRQLTGKLRSDELSSVDNGCCLPARPPERCNRFCRDCPASRKRATTGFYRRHRFWRGAGTKRRFFCRKLSWATELNTG